MARALRRVVGLVGDVARLDHHDIEFNSLRQVIGGGSTSPGGGGGGGGSNGGGIVAATYWTYADETGLLPNSRVLPPFDWTIQKSSAAVDTILAGKVAFLGYTVLGADQTAVLPVADVGAIGDEKFIKKMDGNAFYINITCALPGDLIDGYPSYSVGTVQFSGVTLICSDIGEWIVKDVKP